MLLGAAGKFAEGVKGNVEMLSKEGLDEELWGRVLELAKSELK